MPVVILSPNADMIQNPSYLKEAGYDYNAELDKWNIADIAPDYIYLGEHDIEYELPERFTKFLITHSGKFRKIGIHFRY